MATTKIPQTNVPLEILQPPAGAPLPDIGVVNPYVVKIEGKGDPADETRPDVAPAAWPGPGGRGERAGLGTATVTFQGPPVQLPPFLQKKPQHVYPVIPRQEDLSSAVALVPAPAEMPVGPPYMPGLPVLDVHVTDDWVDNYGTPMEKKFLEFARILSGTVAGRAAADISHVWLVSYVRYRIRDHGHIIEDNFLDEYSKYLTPTACADVRKVLDIVNTVRRNRLTFLDIVKSDKYWTDFCGIIKWTRELALLHQRSRYMDNARLLNLSDSAMNESITSHLNAFRERRL